MKLHRALLVAIWLASVLVCPRAQAQPELFVSDAGLNGSNNRLWRVEIAPDPALFSVTQQAGLGGSLDVELDFLVAGASIVSADKNATDWPRDNPGNNPFLGGNRSDGIVIEAAAGTIFAALGSEIFTSGDAVEVLTIETFGPGATTLHWGGNTIDPGEPLEYATARIAQGGSNFDGYMGSLTSSTMPALSADFDNDGDVDDADYAIWQASFGATAGQTRSDGDTNDDGDVDGGDFLNWQALAGSVSSVAATAAVPEPHTALLALSGWIICLAAARLRQGPR